MRLFHFMITALLIFSSQAAFSQQQKATSFKQITKIHYYTFKGQASTDQLNFLQQDLKSLEFVTEVKIEYKAEKGAGQVRLISKEKEILGEGEKELSPASIKRTITNKGFMPVEYRSEIVNTQ